MTIFSKNLRGHDPSGPPLDTAMWDTASWCARNICEKRYSNCFYLRSL